MIWGGGAWGATGGIPQIIMCYVNFGVFNSGKSKNPNPRKGALRGGAYTLHGVLSPIQPNIMCYVNSGIFNSGESKKDLNFYYRV